MNRERIPIHVEIWIASWLLSKQKDVFSNKELKELIGSIFNDYRHGISTHISSCCVVNKNPNHPKNYNYLFWVSQGCYKIYTKGDFIHPNKIGCQCKPSIDDIPVEHRYLLDENYEDVSVIPEPPVVKIKSDIKKYIPQSNATKRINLKKLKEYEKEAIDQTILMMAYNPSCARIFSKEANKEIKEKIFSVVQILPSIISQEEFDFTHKSILDDIVFNIRNYREKNPSGRITYGQAQKGLNVFLKVYVDWANFPTEESANVVRTFLHCPLDSFVMKTIKRRERNLYAKFGNLPCDMKGISSYEQYMNWQKLIDEIINKESSDLKRTLVDVVWYLESLKKKE